MSDQQDDLQVEAQHLKPFYVELTYPAEDGVTVEQLRKTLEMIYLMEPHGVPQNIIGTTLNDHHLKLTLQNGSRE